MLDRNANGTIDSGQELFGVDTLITNANGTVRTARDGFEALRTLDANTDGIFNASDAAFSQVRLWQDANQDGISQSSELFTLASRNIASIALTPIGNAVNLGNGNTVTGQATVTRTNGTTTQIDSVAVTAPGSEGASNLELASNPFYRSFTDSIPLTETARALPEMGGSGVVRDLREAMSLGTSQSAALVSAVQAFATGTTRSAQHASLDELLRTWAATEQVADRFNIQAMGQETRRFTVNGSSDAALQAQLNRVIPILEVFNGMTVDDSGWPSTMSTVNGQTVRTYAMAQEQVNSMLAAYDTLRSSVYDALVTQTRLQPYLDSIQFIIEDAGVRFDTTPLAAMLSSTRVVDVGQGITDLVELIRYASPTLQATRYDGVATLRTWIDALPSSDPLRAELTALDVLVGNLSTGTARADIFLGGSEANNFFGGAGNDIISGGDGNDYLTAEAGDDNLQGGAGSDNLSGGQGNDIYVGGAGSDTLSDYSGTSNDVYRFGRGDGADSVSDYGGSDRIELVGLNAADVVSVSNTGSSLVVNFGGGDQLTVNNIFNSSTGALNTTYAIESLRFADGTNWDVARLQSETLRTTAGADTIYGFETNDTISSGDGHDNVSGRDGNDVLSGGAGNDNLSGDAGNDALLGEAGDDNLSGGAGGDDLQGGAGSDYLSGDEGNDTFAGGAGSDRLYDYSGTSNDVYRFGRGDGQDYIADYGGSDRIELTGLNAVDVTAVRNDGSNLNIYFSGSGDLIQVGVFGGSAYIVESLRFADGSSWDMARLRTEALRVTSGADNLIGFETNDSISGGEGNDNLSGRAGNDVLAGDAGDDYLYGDDGQDTLRGGSGLDQLVGGGGNDTILFGRDSGRDVVDARDSTGSGSDRLMLDAGIAPSEVKLTRDGEHLVIQVAATRAQLTVLWYFSTNAAGQPMISLQNIGFADGTTWNLAEINARVVTPVANVSTTAQGIDTVTVGASAVLASDQENLTMSGTMGVRLMGNALNNIVTGGSGDDVINGPDVLDSMRWTINPNGGLWYGQDYERFSREARGGVDTLVGGAGDDIYYTTSYNGETYGQVSYIEGADDSVIENPGEGNDTVITTAYFETLDANVENLISFNAQNFYRTASPGQPAAPISASYTGNELNNRIDASYVIATSRLDGGAGADELIGSDGAPNIYVVDNVGDRIIEVGTGIGSSIDTVESSISYALGNGLENLTLMGAAAISGTGNLQGNVLNGSNNSSANALSGLGGDDTYVIDLADSVTESAGGGTDGVVVMSLSGTSPSSLSLDAWQNVENLSLTGQIGDIDLVGNSGANVLTGSFGSNRIAGLDGDDTLFGFAPSVITWNSYYNRYDYPSQTGSDTLDGGAGNDNINAYTGLATIIGGAGNDNVYLQDVAYANVDAGSGNDSLYLSNRINGGGGIGVVDYQFGVGAGNDVITSIGARTAADWAASPIICSTIALSGSTDASAIRFGRDGDALIVAIFGAPDRLRVDHFFESETSDSIASSMDSVKLSDGTILTRDAIAIGLRQLGMQTPSNGDDLLITSVSGGALSAGAGNDVVVGQRGTDQLDGGIGNDQLLGGDGADLLIGGAGDDWLVGGNGSDRYEFSSGSGHDIVDELQSSLRHAYSWPPRGDDGSLDEIVFDSSVNRSDIQVTLTGQDLLLTNTVTGDSVKVVNYFADYNLSTGHFETIRFQDGTTWDRATVLELVSTITGTQGDDLLMALPTSSRLYGLAGNDTLFGAGGNDILDGGVGADYLEGSSGDDVYRVDDANDVVVEASGGGVDRIEASIGQTLLTNVENLTLTGTSTIDGTGNASNNMLIGNLAANRLDGKAGADTMQGASGDDVYVVDNAADVVTEFAGEGNDTIESSLTLSLATINNVENLTLTGSANLNATGNALNNALRGNAGANRIDGGLGADTMSGAAGNDTYVVDDSSDVIVELAAGGTDAVEAWANCVLSSEIEKITLMGSGDINATGNGLANTLIGNGAANRLDGGSGADSMTGGAGDDVYVVDNSADTTTEGASAGLDTVESSIAWTLSSNLENLVLIGTTAINGTGNSLANVITGNGAANRLDGSGGVDTLIGGGGNDTYVIDNSADIVTELAGGGADGVESSVTWAMGVEVESLTLTGTGNINGTGNASANTLVGNAGANRLDGGAGADAMTGGAGNDTYVVDAAGDTTIEAASGGTDTVEASLTWTLAAEVENLTLTGSVAINGSGNALANTLRGNAGNNVLSGLAGNDTMIGGAGDDTYVVDATGDVVTENAGEGTDLVQSSVTWTLGSNVENLTLTGTSALNGTGNSLANALVGNSAANTLNGGAGADTMTGGAGDDVYVVDDTLDVVVEAAGQGTDRIDSSVTYSASAQVENLTLTGTGSINATGNDLANTLIGNAGNNRLDGGAGVDAMTGGAGNDVYVVDVAGDTAVEAASGGTDTIEASLSWTLGSELENLTLTGTAALNATGNALANTLRGNAGNNILSGLAGNDTMIGGAGDDTYIVDVTTDVLTENANEGTDSVQSALTWTLGNNLENLTLTGTSAVNGTGNTLDNVLAGNSANNTLTGAAGNDTLDGGTGNDTMVGGAGNDTYFANVATDVVTENANEGTDTVNSAVAWTLGNNLENLTLTGTSAINGTGNTLNNVLTGNSAANTLTAGAGNDTLDGGAGNDTMLGGAGDDVYMVNVATDVVTENANEGTDTIRSDVAWTLATNFENLTLTGTGAVNATGNAGNNVLSGNGANNTLTGNAGNDTLDGAAGSDTLIGGTGNDTYVLGRGYGAESVQENDTTSGNADVMQFLSGVANDQIWLRRVSNDLEVSIIGTSDQATLSNWYLGNQYHVEQFRTSDGKVLLDSQVQNLVNAMASFAPPAAGQTTLPPNYQSSLAPTIAANWAG